MMRLYREATENEVYHFALQRPDIGWPIPRIEERKVIRDKQAEADAALGRAVMAALGEVHAGTLRSVAEEQRRDESAFGGLIVANVFDAIAAALEKERDAD